MTMVFELRFFFLEYIVGEPMLYTLLKELRRDSDLKYEAFSAKIITFLQDFIIKKKKKKMKSTVWEL